MSCSQYSRHIAAALGLALLLGFAACGDEDGGLDPIIPAGGLDIPASEYVSGVSRDGAAAPYTAEEMPTGAGDAPVLLGARQYVVGGSIVVQVSPPLDATELLITVDSSSEGYWTVDLQSAAKTATPEEAYVGQAGAVLEKMAVVESPAFAQQLADNSYLINVTPTGESGRSSFRLEVVARTPAGLTREAVHSVFRNATANGSDWLQVSLNWIHPVDMDLHVEVPEGADIYWAGRSGPNGGFLDLDSNAACGIDGIQNENIRWMSHAPTPGNYIIRLDLWSACDQVEVFPYLISVILNGEMTLYQGEISPNEADGGGEYSGRLIANINVPAAP